MNFGRDRRKNASQTFAYLAFRWVAIWIIIAACMQYGSAGQAVALGIIAMDICVAGTGRGMLLAINEQTRVNWFERLTNRCFYAIFWNNVKAGNSRFIDVDELFKEATVAARDDIKKAEEDEHFAAGFLDKTSWHWIGGVLHFVGLVFWTTLYYGSAMVIGGARH